MTLPELWSDAFWLSFGIAALGGFFRGFSGFGGVMAMTPLFALIMPAPLAAVLSIVLDALGAVPVMPRAFKDAQHRTAWIMAAAATAALLPGVWILTTVDPEIMRNIVAITVVFAALLLLSPWRYKGPQTVGSDITVGALSGFLAGSTSMAGPPFILYLTALRRSAAVTRATFIYYSMLMTAGAFVFFWWFGILTLDLVFLAAALAPANIAAVMIGQRLFRLINDDGFRRFTLVFLVALGGSVLVFG